MKQFISFVIKEAKHILRDKRTMLILFGMPVVMMILFGFAITTDVKNVRTVVVTSQMDHLTQTAVERLAQSEYFTITQIVSTPQEAERLIRSQKADMAMVFSHDFASKKDGIQLIVDGSDPNMAAQWTNYAQGVLVNMQGSMVNSKMLYNPQMKSAYNFVPAIMGMLMMLICAMMTSISIVRVARLARPPTYGNYCQGRTLSGARFRHSHHHSADGSLCAGCAVARLAVLDSCHFYLIYIISALAGTAHLECGTDTTRCPATLGHGAADACADALRHDVSNRVDAQHSAMDIHRHSTALLYRGHAQADDYGCGCR